MDQNTKLDLVEDLNRATARYERLRNHFETVLISLVSQFNESGGDAEIEALLIDCRCLRDSNGKFTLEGNPFLKPMEWCSEFSAREFKHI